ncbi:EF-hand domain-containing family member B [Perognathus longimembris pacificus]|uniref:EF-hand domain-containing family member B n=1 Tax=Perognathus longimembris pacificus TaxID=214514 RepID=UPI00201A2000|nr:EF-hand domain-containing family member B [Perognathus longimembris pacificus]
MTGPGENSPLSMEVCFTQKGKDDLEDRSTLMGTKPPTELGLGLGLEKGNRLWEESPAVRNHYHENLASSETKPPLGPGPEMGLLERQIALSAEKYNLGGDGASDFRGAQPLGVLPERRVGLEYKYLEGCPGGWVTPPPLTMPCRLPQAERCKKEPKASGPEETKASVGKQPVSSLEPGEQQEKKSTCVVVKPRIDLDSVDVDIGLPPGEDADETKAPEPQVGLVIEPPWNQFVPQPEEKKEAANTEQGVEPPDCIRPIYSGKYFDRTPCLPSAGKIKPVGYRVATCLTEKLPRLITPPEAKKYFNFRYPPPGEERIFYGRANDPQIAPYLTHGIRSKITVPAHALINPQPITRFQQLVKDKKESVYLSNQQAPLGRSQDQTPGLPKGLDIIKTTFGTPVIREFSAREVVNPPKSHEEVLKEGNEGHDLYVVSHNDYYAGEPKNRKYNPSSFQTSNVFGVRTPHYNNGKGMAKSLYWLHELQMKNGSKIVSKRVDDFKEKFQHKVGRVLDPIAETMNIPPGHAFGGCLHPEMYGVGDLIHNRPLEECLRGKDRQRAMIAAVRHHLKKFNFQNFDSLLEAFHHYDKNGDGMIDKVELLGACSQANLRLDTKLLDQLFDYCDVDNDGMINYLEFANFLNWKDKFTLKEYEKRVIIKGRKPDCTYPAEANLEETEPTLLIKPEDMVPKEPGSSEQTLRTLLRPTDKVAHCYTTTSSEINAVVGAVPSICYPIFGVPTVRSDIPAPRIRRISDRTNYGKDGNAYSLLHPTIFAQKGVYERDFFQARSKEEIKEILCNIGVQLSEEEFETVWNLASKKHHRGEVCVETIRNALDELLQKDLTKCKTAGCPVLALVNSTIPTGLPFKGIKEYQLGHVYYLFYALSTAYY